MTAMILGFGEDCIAGFLQNVNKSFAEKYRKSVCQFVQGIDESMNFF